MYGYIYLTENLINGKCYLGKHKSNHRNKTYIGSGIQLTRAIKKYGRNNFVATIVEWCDSLEQLNEKEKYWIAKCDAVKSSFFYNISYGGDGGKTMLGRHQSEHAKEKMRQQHLGKKLSEDTKKKIGDSVRGLKRTEKNKQNNSKASKKRWENDDGSWHKIVSETLSKSNKGRAPWNKGLSAKNDERVKANCEKAHASRRKNNEYKRQNSKAN